MKTLSSGFLLLVLAALPAAGQTAGIQDSRFKIQEPASAAAYFRAADWTAPARHTRREFCLLLGLNLGLDVVDTQTSEMAQRRGAVETWSSWKMGPRPSASRMELTLAAQAAIWSAAAIALDRRGHHRLARLAQLGGVGEEAAAITNNLLWLEAH